YSATLSDVAAGLHSLTAHAVDDQGFATTSSPVTVTVNAAPALYYIHTDHLNTPRIIASQAGTTVWRNDNAEPFGNSAPNGDPGNTGVAFDFPLRFPGQYADTETGPSYNYYRDYDPAIGGYKQSDLVGLGGGINTYVYVLDPLTQVDPEGLMGRAPGTFGKPGGPSSTAPTTPSAAPISCEGEWSSRGFDEQLPKVLRLCTCYWLCISCNYPTIWSGNKR